MLAGMGAAMTAEGEALLSLGSDLRFLGGFGLAIGLAIGSFLNVVIHRFPLGQSIVFPASHCPGCQSPIRPLDNIPLLSYLLLHGKCRQCGTQISLRYPAVEFLTGLVFAGIAIRFGFAWATLLFWTFSAGLIVAALVDLDHQIIPDEVSLGGLMLGLVAVPLWQIQLGVPAQAAFMRSFFGALLGGGVLWLVGFLHARVSVMLGREFEHWPGAGEAIPRPRDADYWLWFPGMGLGDVKLLAMIGAFLGPTSVMTTVIFASVLGLLAGLIYGLLSRSLTSPFGFGPAIAAAALIVLLVPDPMRFFL